MLDSGGSATSSAQRALAKTGNLLSRIFSKVSSGKIIPSEKPADAAVATALYSKSRTLSVAETNINYGGFLINTADGAASEITNILQRQRELATAASSGQYSDEQRALYDAEYQQLNREIERIAGTTNFNGTAVFGNGEVNLQVGTDSSADSQITLSQVDITSTINTSLSIATQSDAASAADSTAASIAGVSRIRGDLGSVASRLSSALENTRSQGVETERARSAIEDIDFAEALTQKTAADIRQQGAASVFKSVNLSQQRVLDLLK